MRTRLQMPRMLLPRASPLQCAMMVISAIQTAEHCVAASNRVEDAAAAAGGDEFDGEAIVRMLRNGRAPSDPARFTVCASVQTQAATALQPLYGSTLHALVCVVVPRHKLRRLSDTMCSRFVPPEACSTFRQDCQSHRSCS